MFQNYENIKLYNIETLRIMKCINIFDNLKKLNFIIILIKINEKQIVLFYQHVF